LVGGLWRARKNLLWVPLRCRRKRRQQGGKNIIAKFLRLIHQQHISRKTTTGRLRPSNKLNRTAILQIQGFLAVSSPNILNEPGELGKLKETKDATERGPSGLNLVCSPQHALTPGHSAIERASFQHRSFTVLSRNRNAAPRRNKHIATIHGQPRLEHVRLPIVQRQTAQARQSLSLRTKRTGAIGNCDHARRN